MQVVYIDNERTELDKFRLAIKGFSEIESVAFFDKEEDALSWCKKNQVDVVFLDVELEKIHGLDLARFLKQIAEDICIVFVTANKQYALQAFGVDAIGYILKPYTQEDVYKELLKAKKLHPTKEKRVKIETIPSFVVSVNDEVLHLGRSKAEELLALLVDKAGCGLTVGEAIACLWPWRTNDENTQSLYRVTCKRLMDALKEVGIADIIVTHGREKYIKKDKVECDLYQILAGDVTARNRYAGEYLREYSWAENRNAQLSRMLLLTKEL